MHFVSVPDYKTTYLFYPGVLRVVSDIPMGFLA
jgi:hypothetical protein